MSVKKTAALLRSPTLRTPFLGPLKLESYNCGKNVCVNLLLQQGLDFSVLVSMEISRSGRITIQPCLDLALVDSVVKLLENVHAPRVPL